MDISTTRFPAVLAPGSNDTIEETTMAAASRTARRPRSVTAAVLLHFAIAAAFLSIPLVGLACGADVRAAVDAEVTRQGQNPAVLSQNGVNFNETGSALWAPTAVAVLVALIGAIIVSERRVGRILSWIALPLVLIGNFLIMADNAAVVPTLQAHFAESGDPALQGLDVQALVDAAYAAYPGWLPVLEGARFVIVTLGCLSAVALLALRPARAFFRKV